MNTVAVKIKRELFRFESQQQWVNKARSWFGSCGVKRGHYLCLDKFGRVCEKGAEFIRATNEGSYPIVVYELDGLSGGAQ